MRNAVFNPKSAIVLFCTPHDFLCGNNRVVFNIAGNKFRLVVEMQYRAGIVWVKFVGTHAQYDQIYVGNINEY